MDAPPTAPRAHAPEAPAAPPRETGALPNLIVLGAQKCGTSTLHYYLGLHPQVAMSQTKELNFFIQERNWGRGVDWYRRQFDTEAAVRGETSPNYSAHPVFAGVPERMHSIVPDARLIYLVRDPLERIAAHWVHNVAKGRVEADLARTLRAKTTYVTRSRYHMQLQRFFAFYPRERILILEQEDLRAHRDTTLREAFEFIGVDPAFSHPRFSEERHKTQRKRAPTRLGARLAERRARARRPIVPDRLWDAVSGYWPLGRAIERPQIAAALDPEALAVLREDAVNLRELTGRSFERWSIWQV